LTAAFSVFATYPKVEKYVDVAVFSVSSNYRGHGIGLKLMTALIEQCRQSGIPIISVMCSSLFTVKVGRKLGFKVVFEKAFKDMEFDSLPIVDMPEPHTHTRIIIKEL